MRAPSRVDHAIEQKQSRPFQLLSWIEDYNSAGAVIPSSWIGSLNLLRAAKFLSACSHIERVQALVVFAHSILRHTDDVNRPVRASGGVNHGRGCDSDFWRHLPTA